MRTAFFPSFLSRAAPTNRSPVFASFGCVVDDLVLSEYIRMTLSSAALLAVLLLSVAGISLGGESPVPPDLPPPIYMQFNYSSSAAPLCIECPNNTKNAERFLCSSNPDFTWDTLRQFEDPIPAGNALYKVRTQSFYLAVFFCRTLVPLLRSQLFMLIEPHKSYFFEYTTFKCFILPIGNAFTLKTVALIKAPKAKPRPYKPAFLPTFLSRDQQGLGKVEHMLEMLFMTLFVGVEFLLSFMP
jgi:hypothetical protein